MKSLFARFVREEEGQDLVEYALIVTLVALVVFAGATALGTQLNAWYQSMSANVGGLATKAGS